MHIRFFHQSHNTVHFGGLFTLKQWIFSSLKHDPVPRENKLYCFYVKNPPKRIALWGHTRISILASVQMSLPRKSSRIMLKMSIFHRRLNDLFLLRRRVIMWLDTAADEAWAQGQISRYPGWYSQLMYITYPIPGFSTSTFEHDCEHCNVIKGEETRRNR